MSETLGIDHLGLTVRDLAASLGFFTGALFFEEFIPYTRAEDSDG